MQNFGSLPPPLDVPVRLGSLGVTFFFVLSGFVLTWSMRPAMKVSTFYVNRFARIWPSHIVALLLAIPVFYTLSVPPEHSWIKPFNLPILLLSVFLLQGFSRAPEVLFSGNPAAWTLSCEAFFYMLHPYLAALLRKASKRGALIALSAVVSIAFIYRSFTQLMPSSWVSNIPLPFERVTEFALGMTMAWAFVQGWRPRIPVTVAWLIFTTIMLWLTLGPNHKWGIFSVLSSNFLGEFATLACAVLITAVVSNSLRGIRSWLEHPWMVRLGNWSYTFYLVHATIIYAVMNIIGGSHGPGMSNLIWGVGIFAIALGLAAAIHHWVEAPVERVIRGWKNRRDQAAL